MLRTTAMTSQNKVLDADAIRMTEAVIQAHVRRTPTIEIGGAQLDLDDSLRITLKLEFMQHAGSFKARGAFANLKLRAVPEGGVAAASGGNHGAAVAYAARELGVPASIFVPNV